MLHRFLPVQQQAQTTLLTIIFSFNDSFFHQKHRQNKVLCYLYCVLYETHHPLLTQHRHLALQIFHCLTPFLPCHLRNNKLLPVPHGDALWWSVCFGVFLNRKSAKQGLIKIKKKLPNYWCVLTKSI